MDTSGKIGNKLLTVEPCTGTDQKPVKPTLDVRITKSVAGPPRPDRPDRRRVDPLLAELQSTKKSSSVWGDCDEKAASNFWLSKPTSDQVANSDSLPNDFRWTPSEAHRLKFSADVGKRFDHPLDAEIAKLDKKIAETFVQLRASPRDSAERQQFARQLDVLKVAKHALEDELADTENWSA
jgi:hypothetical protein